MTDQDRPPLDLSRPQPNVISALKRLERLGSENSRQAEKLIDAAIVAGEAIAACVPEQLRGLDDEDEPIAPLPRGYYVHGPALTRPSSDYAAIHSLTRFDVTRAVALAFAEDIATGWLDELADWLEAQGEADAQATARLSRAAQALRR